MKLRKHHNNKGYRKIKRDKCHKKVKHIALKLGLVYKE